MKPSQTTHAAEVVRIVQDVVEDLPWGGHGGMIHLLLAAGGYFETDPGKLSLLKSYTLFRMLYVRACVRTYVRTYVLRTYFFPDAAYNLLCTTSIAKCLVPRIAQQRESVLGGQAEASYAVCSQHEPQNSAWCDLHFPC